MLNGEQFNKLARAALETSEYEIGCGDCLEQVDSFVELELAGLDADAAMPLVYNHLQKCGDCLEEFEALLAALKDAEESSGGSTPGAIGRLWRRTRRAFEE